MHPDLDAVAVTKDFAVATFRQALLVHFRLATSMASVRAMRKGMTELARAGGKGIVYFAVIEVASTPPDEEVRKDLTRFFEEQSAHLSGAIVTYRGEGFRGAAVRTIVSGVLNLMPKVRFGFSKHVVGSLEEAATLAHKTSPAIDTAALLEAFRALSVMPPAA